VAGQIIRAGADYVLALKDNHPTLHEEVALWLETGVAQGRLEVQETVEKDHARVEVRRYSLSADIGWLASRQDWSGLAAVGRVESIRQTGNKQSRECRYFLSSVTEPAVFARVVRDHWAIENSP
jgi:hypothetical protein